MRNSEKYHTSLNVIKEKSLFRVKSCSVKACAFGSFVAMDIESMEFQIPHSDLVQISEVKSP